MRRQIRILAVCSAVAAQREVKVNALNLLTSCQSVLDPIAASSMIGLRCGTLAQALVTSPIVAENVAVGGRDGIF